MATSRPDKRRQNPSAPRRKRVAGPKPKNASTPERKPLQVRDTGYRVGSNRRHVPGRTVDPTLVIFAVAGILVVIALIFGISSCVRGCSSSRKADEKAEETKEVNAQDPRVALGVSPETTSKFTDVLDRNEQFEHIAANANKIGDERLIDLAIAEPEAIDFVANSINNNGSVSGYDGTVAKGEFPKLYAFDKRWGYMTFGDGIMGVTGSGPVALSIASMGLSGTTANGPDVVAKAIVAAKLATGASGMDNAFVTNHASEVGLAGTGLEVSADGLYYPLTDGTPVLVRVKADSGIGSAKAHWLLITALNSDGSVSIVDPTSAVASSHTWSVGAIASGGDSAFMLMSSAGDYSDASYDEGEGY